MLAVNRSQTKAPLYLTKRKGATKSKDSRIITKHNNLKIQAESNQYKRLKKRKEMEEKKWSNLHWDHSFSFLYQGRCTCRRFPAWRWWWGWRQVKGRCGWERVEEHLTKDVASRDFDLHEIKEPIGDRDRDGSHAGRKSNPRLIVQLQGAHVDNPNNPPS